MDDYNNNVPQTILKKSNLSQEEKQLIEYYRRYPEKLQELINQINRR